MILLEEAPHFQFFASQVKHAIEHYGKLDSDKLLVLQRERVDGLSQLETDFKEALLKHHKCQEAFDAFYDEILVKRKNLLSARPFFRERHETFGLGIMEGIKNRDVATVAKYHFNYHLISLMVKSVDFGKNSELLKIFSEIMRLRQELVLMNLPLIISRARIFYSRTPKAHLNFMDFVQIGVGGLLSAIDKYCGTYARVWRSVVIGRVSGDYIKELNQTTIHFYPDDKRRLYRANKFLSRKTQGEYSEEELLEKINAETHSNVSKIKATIDDVRQLLSAASVVSCDTRPPLDDENVGEENVNRLSSPAETRPDVAFEQHESMEMLFKNIEGLSLFDKKLLKMKGIELD